MNKFYLILLFIPFFAGCAELKIERRVDNNVFHSTNLPKMRMSVDNSLNYMGEQKSEVTVSHGDFSHSAYISAYPFVNVKVEENNCIQEMFIIVIGEFKDRAVKIQYKYGENSIEVGGEKYIAYAAAGTKKQWFDKHRISFLDVGGYIFSDRYWGMSLYRRLGTDAWMNIVYLEEVLPFNNYRDYKETVLRKGLEAFVINAFVINTVN